jgi:hypothetical protein
VYSVAEAVDVVSVLVRQNDEQNKHSPRLTTSTTTRPAKSSFWVAPSSSNTPTNSFWYAWKSGKMQARQDFQSQMGLRNPSMMSDANA